MKGFFWKGVFAVLLLFFAPPGTEDPASAFPNAVQDLCGLYPGIPSCISGTASCLFCHTSASGGNRNPFGNCLQKAGGFSNGISVAIKAVENDDCDGDTFSNLDELFAGTFPGDAASKPVSAPPTESLNCEDRNKLTSWNVCGFDPVHALKRVASDFCRRPVNFSELENYRKLSAADQREALHNKLDDCLSTEAWKGKDGVLWRMAHSKINPVQTIKSGENGGSIPLGDYDDDYALWVFYNLDNRDVRGVLTAQHYVVREDNPTRYLEVRDAPLHKDATGIPAIVEIFFQNESQQFIPEQKRAGMLTTTWNMVSRTMFTSTPRTTAAQALRSYLGIDIAKGQGLAELYPDAAEFTLVDHDNKGVTARECAYCHKALDPVTFPFTEYNGLSFNVDGPALTSLLVSAVFNGATRDCGDIQTTSLGNILTGDISQLRCFVGKASKKARSDFLNNPKVLLPAIFKDTRIEVLAALNKSTEPNLAGTPTSGFLFGEPVNDLVEWARVAADSDAYAKNVVQDFWLLMIGRAPEADDAKSFEKLWKNLKNRHGYGVNRMLHELIEQEVYGAP